MNNERVYEYEQNCLRLERVKKQIRSQEVMDWLALLSQYRIVQHQKFIKLLLIFMGYQERDIIKKYTSELDWLKIRSYFVNEEFINKIISWNHRFIFKT